MTRFMEDNLHDQCLINNGANRVNGVISLHGFSRKLKKYGQAADCIMRKNIKL